MAFLHPVLLWGLGFLLVPIILMLFLNRRKLVLPWAAYKWMRNAIVERKKKVQTDNLLKLISKLLLILAVVLMISRPFYRTKAAAGNTLVIVDNSPSMGVSYDAGTRLDRAKDMLGKFISSGERSIALYSFDGKLEPLLPKFTKDRGMLTGAVKNLKPGSTYAGAATLFEELRRAPILKETKTIVVIGDFQKRWYDDGRQIAEAMKQLGAGYPMVWHQVDSRADIQNCAVENISMSSDGAFLGRECFFNVQVFNGSAQPTADRTLSFFVDGKRKQFVTLKLQPNERREVPFAVVLDSEGWHNISAEIDSDPFEGDNTRYAVVNVPPPLRLLTVVPAGGKETFPLDTYVSSALHSIIPGDKLVYKTISLLELSSARLSEADVLILVKIPLNAGASYENQVRAFAEQGGGLVAFLPAENPAEAGMFGIQAAVSQTAGKVNQKLLRGTYLDFMDAPDMRPDNITFTRSLIFEKTTQENVRLTVEAGPNALSLPFKKGRVILLGFVPGPGYSNLHLNPNFVQMMLRILWETRQRQTLSSISGKFDSWPSADLNRDHAYTLHDQRDNSWNLTVEGLGDKMRLLIPADLGYGFYSIREDGQEKFRLAYNMDTGDSHMEPVTLNELKDTVKEGLTFSTADVISGSLARHDLIPLTICLLLAALVFEAYAHFFRE